jgi:hypothetical protein
MTDMPRSASMIAWCVLVLVGTIVLVGWGRGASPVASRHLPLNTLLMSGDLLYQSVTGRYVVAPDGIKQGSPVRPEDLSEQPVLPSAAGRLLLTLDVLRRDVTAQRLNAGSAVQLCGKAPTDFARATVLLVRCPSDKPDAACSVLLDVPPDKAGDIAGKGLKDDASRKELRLAASCG